MLVFRDIFDKPVPVLLVMPVLTLIWFDELAHDPACIPPGFPLDSML